MKKKHTQIKATIEVLGHKYHVEEFSENNGDNRYLFSRVDGKGKNYPPRIDTVGNCLTAFTNIYTGTVSIKDIVIGCDKTNVGSAIELGYINNEGKWLGKEPPKELDAFIIVLHTHLKRRSAREIKKEMEKKERMEKNKIKKEIFPKVEKENVGLVDPKYKVKRLFNAYLETADENAVKILEDFVSGQMFIEFKEKLISGF
jgi:hypothetical protein